MKNEEAIKFLSNYLDEEVYSEKCIDAHSLAIAALRHESEGRDTNVPTTAFGEPLTLKQMQALNGQPVWVAHPSIPSKGRWYLVTFMAVDSRTMRPMFRIVSPDGTIVVLEMGSYGESWIAYAYHPILIDLDDGPALERGLHGELH